MDADTLKRIMPGAKMADCEKYAGFLDQIMPGFGINTPERQAAFLAQLAHESGQLRYVREIASGKAYEGRKDLGNTQPGDGPKFRGRGLIQITGRANYRECGDDLGAELEDNPELLEEPDLAVASACWFWATRGLNELADAGDFRKITRKINGGTNGLADRMAFWERAKAELC